MGALEAMTDTESLRAVVGRQRAENATRIEERGSTCMTDRSGNAIVYVAMNAFSELYRLHSSRDRTL
jgi:hypothetical protein